MSSCSPSRDNGMIELFTSRYLTDVSSTSQFNSIEIPVPAHFNQSDLCSHQPLSGDCWLKITPHVKLSSLHQQRNQVSTGSKKDFPHRHTQKDFIDHRNGKLFSFFSAVVACIRTFKCQFVKPFSVSSGNFVSQLCHLLLSLLATFKAAVETIKI